MKFIVVSDTHFTIKGIRSDKGTNVQTIVNTIAGETNIDAVLVVGDLTDVGADGSLDCVSGRCQMTNNELASFRTHFVDAIDEHADVYMCHGNHDTYTIGLWQNICNCCLGRMREYERNYPVTNYISNYNTRHDLEASFEKCYMFRKKGVVFLSLGLYPDVLARQFINQVKHRIVNDKIVVFFHYNLEGPYSDWFPNEEKDLFYNAIIDLQVICICVGHNHETYTDHFWNRIRVVSGAGEMPILCTYENGSLDCRVL